MREYSIEVEHKDDAYSIWRQCITLLGGLSLGPTD
jgi:hypothetical protein